MNQQQGRRVQHVGPHETIKEQFFSSGNALLRPIRIALGDAHPMGKRLPNMPSYDPAVAKEHDDRFKRAQTFLYEQRNLVNDKYLPRYDIRPGKSEDEAAHAELVGLVVDGCFDRLYENLMAYAPMLLPEKDAKEVMPTLSVIFEKESKRLRASLQNYRVTLRPAFTALAQDLE